MAGREGCAETNVRLCEFSNASLRPEASIRRRNQGFFPLRFGWCSAWAARSGGYLASLVGYAPCAKKQIVADGGMTINLEFVNADNPTPSFEADIETAAGILSTQIRNQITVNLSIGCGEVDGQPLSDGEAAAGPDGSVFDSYRTVRHDLIDAQALGARTLPTGSSINGESSVAVWSTQEKLFGQLSPIASGLDGSAGFATDVQTITGTDVLVVSLYMN
jgi:hypothetical protein